jgi:hypothetical protein
MMEGKENPFAMFEVSKSEVATTCHDPYLNNLLEYIQNIPNPSLNTPRIDQNPPDTNESPKFTRLRHYSTSDISAVFLRYDILRIFL